MNIDSENKSNILQIQVYDNFTIDFNKYPRKNTNKYETDKVIIQFMMNQDYLEKVAKSYTTAVQFFNECKEYYFILKSLDGKNSKRYSAKELMFIINQISLYSQKNPDIYSIQKYLRNFHPLDQLYYILIKNKEFYLELFRNVTDAKYAFFERREINYKFFIPFDFYGDIKHLNSIKGQVYTAIELLEINAYTQFLVKNKIIKNLPEPLFIRNYFHIDNYLKNNENSNKKDNNKKSIKNIEIENNNIKEKNKSIFIEKTKTIENDFLMDLNKIINESFENYSSNEEYSNDEYSNDEYSYKNQDNEYEYDINLNNDLKNNNNDYNEYYENEKNELKNKQNYKEENKKKKKNKKEKNELKEMNVQREIKNNNFIKKQENINTENFENNNNDIKIIYFHK